MTQKTIHYQRKGCNYTFSKDVFSFDEFEALIPLFDERLRQLGHQTFGEYLKSYSRPDAAAAAFCIGGKILRKRTLEEAVEANGESVHIVFNIDPVAQELKIESELSDEAIGLELKVLNFHYYSSEHKA